MTMLMDALPTHQQNQLISALQHTQQHLGLNPNVTPKGTTTLNFISNTTNLINTHDSNGAPMIKIQSG
jgi:hypothetical protein